MTLKRSYDEMRAEYEELKKQYSDVGDRFHQARVQLQQQPEHIAMKEEKRLNVLRSQLPPFLFDLLCTEKARELCPRYGKLNEICIDYDVDDKEFSAGFYFEEESDNFENNTSETSTFTFIPRELKTIEEVWAIAWRYAENSPGQALWSVVMDAFVRYGEEEGNKKEDINSELLMKVWKDSTQPEDKTKTYRLENGKTFTVPVREGMPEDY